MGIENARRKIKKIDDLFALKNTTHLKSTHSYILRHF